MNQPVDTDVGAGGASGSDGPGPRNPCPASHFHFQPPDGHGHGMGGRSSRAHRRQSQLEFFDAGFCCMGQEPPGSALVSFSVDADRAAGTAAAASGRMNAVLPVTIGLLGAVLIVLGVWATTLRRNFRHTSEGALRRRKYLDINLTQLGGGSGGGSG